MVSQLEATHLDSHKKDAYGYVNEHSWGNMKMHIYYMFSV